MAFDPYPFPFFFFTSRCLIWSGLITWTWPTVLRLPKNSSSAAEGVSSKGLLSPSKSQKTKKRGRFFFLVLCYSLLLCLRSFFSFFFCCCCGCCLLVYQGVSISGSPRRISRSALPVCAARPGSQAWASWSASLASFLSIRLLHFLMHFRALSAQHSRQQQRPAPGRQCWRRKGNGARPISRPRQRISTLMIPYRLLKKQKCVAVCVAYSWPMGSLKRLSCQWSVELFECMNAKVILFFRSALPLASSEVAHS